MAKKISFWAPRMGMALNYIWEDVAFENCEMNAVFIMMYVPFNYF